MKSRSSGKPVPTAANDHSIASPEAAAEAEARAYAAAARARRRRNRRAVPLVNLAALTATGVLSIFMIAGVRKRYADYNLFHVQVVEKRAQFKAIERTARIEQARLAMLSTGKGRSQLLLERGYVHPGERILLFPNAVGSASSGPDSFPASQVAVAAPEKAAPDAQPISPWRRLWRQLRGLPEVRKSASAPLVAPLSGDSVATAPSSITLPLVAPVLGRSHA